MLQLFVESIEPFETPQERSNCLRRERRTIQQVAARAQPFLSNDALQLFAESTVPSKTPQEQSNRLH